MEWTDSASAPVSDDNVQTINIAATAKPVSSTSSLTACPMSSTKSDFAEIPHSAHLLKELMQRKVSSDVDCCSTSNASSVDISKQIVSNKDIDNTETGGHFTEARLLEDHTQSEIVAGHSAVNRKITTSVREKVDQSFTELKSSTLPTVLTDDTNSEHSVQHFIDRTERSQLSSRQAADNNSVEITVPEEVAQNRRKDIIQNEAEITTLSEDPTPSFVITNVCSIREGDENFNEFDFDISSTARFEAKDQKAEMQSPANQHCTIDSQPFSSYTNERNASTKRTTASSYCDRNSRQIDGVLRSLFSDQSDVIKLNASTQKQKSVDLEPAMALGFKDKLSDISSASALLHGVSRLVSQADSHNRNPQFLTQNCSVAQDNLPVFSLLCNSVPRSSAVDSHTSSSIASKCNVQSAGEHQKGLDGDAIVHRDKQNETTVANNKERRHLEQQEPKAAELSAVKVEPTDTDYEKGPASSACSHLMDAKSVASTAASHTTSTLNNISGRKRLLPQLEVKNSNKPSQIKKARLKKTASKGALTGKVQAVPVSDSPAISIKSQLSFQPTIAVTTSSGEKDVAEVAGVGSSAARTETLKTLSKPLLVPSNCTSQNPATQQHNIPTKGILLNIPSTLSIRPSTSEFSKSGSAMVAENFSIQSRPKERGQTATVVSTVQSGTGQMTTVVSSENPGGNSSTAVVPIEQQLNMQLVNHLRHVQDKPGSCQMLTIPMPDGSTRNVKVVFASAFQPPSVTLPVSISVTPAQTVQPPSVTAPVSICVTPAQTVQPPSVTAPVSICVTPAQTGLFRAVSASGVITSNSVIPAIHVQEIAQKSTANTITSNVLSNQKQSVPLVYTVVPSTVIPLSLSLTGCSTVPISVSLASGTPPQAVTQWLNQDVHFDQVSSEAKLTAKDMAILIKGKNLGPSLEPRLPPKNSNFSHKVYRCVECGIICSTLVGYNVHVKRMSMVVRYACMICKAALVFFNKCTFLAHLRGHFIAGGSVTHVVNLKSYMLSVSSLPDRLMPPMDAQHRDPLVINYYEPITCTECEETVSDSLRLAIHFGSGVRNCPFEHTCSYCRMELPTACSLKAHQRLHHQHFVTFCARPSFVCPECGLRFADQVSLYQHVFATCLHFSRCVILKCPVCSQIVPTPTVLKDHFTLLHARHVQFMCLLCKRHYHSLSTIQQHALNAHNGIIWQQFLKDSCKVMTSCSVCHTLTVDGEEHVMKHVQKEKTKALFGYACLFCKGPVTFDTKHSLLVHLVTKHQAYRFECSICQQGFVTLSLLRIHVLSEHGGSKGNKSDAQGMKCLKCKIKQLASESVLPHVMWHIMRSLTDEPTQPAATQLVTHCMEITLPKDSGKESGEKNLLFCRSCGHVSQSPAALLLHIVQAKHSFLHFFVCPFCQRFDFLNTKKFEEHVRQEGIDRRAIQTGAGSSAVGTQVPVTTFLHSAQPGAANSGGLSNKKSQNFTVNSRPVFNPSQKSWPSQDPRARQMLTKPLTVSLLPLSKLTPSFVTIYEVKTQVSKSASSHRLEINQKKRKTDCKQSLAEEDVEGCTSAVTEPESKAKLMFHPCHLCGLLYKSAIMLSSHLACAHGGQKTVMHCKLCEKKGKEVLLSKANLKKHLTRRHNVAKPMAEAMISGHCDTDPSLKVEDMPDTPAESSLSYNESSPVKRLRIAESEQEQEYVCAKCNFTSSIATDFHQHISIHAVDNCVQCLECGLCFTALSTLKNHLFMVHKIKQSSAYIEQHQIKIKELPNDLARHMDTLTPMGEPEVVIKTKRVYKESLAKSNFLSENHSEAECRPLAKSENLLECNVCYKEFDNETALKTHMRTHGMAFIRSRRANSRQNNEQNLSRQNNEQNLQQTTGHQSGEAVI